MSKNDKPTFKSYLNSSLFVESKKEKTSKSKKGPTFQLHIPPVDDSHDEIPEPEAFVHGGELIIGQAHNVLKFDAFSGLNRGISGSLYCTNFKISFVSANRPTHHLIELDRKNQLFKENDIPLTCVDTIFQVSSSKRKQLQPGTNASRSIKMVEIKCKNFKVHTFSFKFTNKGQVKSVMNTILHYAYITNLHRLFAFSFELPLSSSSLSSSKATNHATDSQNIKGGKEWKSLNAKKAPKVVTAVYRPSSQRISAISDMPERSEPMERAGRTPQFRRYEDWQDEIDRTGARNLRVTAVNQDFRISESLPEVFVVPSVVSDGELIQAAPHFEGGRVPMWCWSHSNGSMLMRAVPLRAETVHSDHEINMLGSLTLIHPSKAQPDVLDLGRLCPSYRDIQTSFQRLHELCMPAQNKKNLKEFWNSDKDWYNNLDATKWMQNISMCMSVAVTAATTICQNEQTVVLREPNGRDTSCIVSSLVQIILDPYCRTQLGFQSLIQREWVIAGHPFLERCGHLTPNDGEEAPTFLLFLDCVNQMMQQFPSAFEFTDTYLITIWDSTFAGIFGTFLFNGERQRVRTCMQDAENPIRLATVWAWSLQYSREDQALFNNPMYIAKQILAEKVPRFRPSSQKEVDHMEGCNPALYRFRARTAKRTILDAKYGSKSQDDSALSTPVHLRDKNLNINGANSTGNSRSSELDPNMIIPQTGPPFIKFWTQCYLRWLPSAHIVGGGYPQVYKQHCQVVDEILQLKEKLDQLRARKMNDVVRRPKRESRLYFTYEDNTRNQGLLTSAFPFSISDLSLIGGDRRSFLGTPLARFLRGQSLMQSDMSMLTATDAEANDEVEL
ncbi:myotubularin-related protein 10-A-like isoform X3 [Acanthaster planci]|uniref:Myotubularin-related protein 10-A-like isoform X3 n=1 Tax=Acanthaster planci TaxID=133434 RepID=A0A8B7Z7S3_ACAPL|nr:myotubularin-related protein 10-A-like isoform X3 [Acanthaster planci]